MIKSIFPEAVADTVKSINDYSNVAKILALNPVSVSQGVRIEFVKKILACDEEVSDDDMFSRAENPTGVVIDAFKGAEEAGGTLIMGISILASSTAFNFALSRLVSKKLSFPSLQVMPYMYFLEPIFKASVAMLIYGNAEAKVVSSIATTLGLVGGGSLG